MGMPPSPMGQEGQLVCTLQGQTRRRSAALPDDVHSMGSILATLGPMGRLLGKLACNCITGAQITCG